MPKLTQAVVKALQPPKNGVRSGYAFCWDQELRGFGVQVMRSGLKSFVVQYRTSEGRTRRFVIGRYGVLSVDEARREARILLGQIAKGIDPAESRKKSSPTVGDVCDWYLAEAEAGRLLGRRRRPIKSSTLAMDRSRIETHIKPLLGRRQVASVKLADIEAAQAAIASGKTAKPRQSARGGVTTGGQGVAARTVSTLHAIFEHAVRLGEIEANPARGVRKLTGEPRQRRLNRSEIERLGRAIRHAEAAGEHPIGLAAIEFLLLTGFRRMEALGLERAWVDLEGGVVRFPDTKSGPQIRALGHAAIEHLSAQLPTGSPFIFSSDSGDGHFVGIVRVLQRICASAMLTDVSPHTLRHTFASVAADLGFSELTIAALLGHAARGVTQRYVHIDDALRLAADRTSSEIDALLNANDLGQRA